MLAGVGCALYYWLTNPAWGAIRVLWYLGTSIVSGAIIAGLIVWAVCRALAATGVLDRFESGRAEARV